MSFLSTKLNIQWFYNYRFNRYDDFYDNWDGDWGWFDLNIDEDREQFEVNNNFC